MAASAPNVIALVADAGMLPAAAFLASRLKTLNPRDDTEIVIFSDSPEQLALARGFGVPAELMYVDFSGRLPSATDRITGAAFFRLFAPAVVQPATKRLLYLDVDIALENDSLFRLFDLDMKDQPIAAARDVYMAYSESEEATGELSRTIGKANRKYLQSGVMLLDRGSYLAANLGERIFSLAVKNRLHDQAAINRLLQGNWLELSPGTNMLMLTWNSFVREVAPPVVVHFMGPRKPWRATFGEDHPVRNEMEQFFKSSPWPRFFEPVPFWQAWNSLQAAHGRPTSAAPPTKQTLPPSTDFEAIARYLRETKFADVEQGITEIHLSRIP